MHSCLAGRWADECADGSFNVDLDERRAIWVGHMHRAGDARVEDQFGRLLESGSRPQYVTAR